VQIARIASASALRASKTAYASGDANISAGGISSCWAKNSGALQATSRGKSGALHKQQTMAGQFVAEDMAYIAYRQACRACGGEMTVRAVSGQGSDGEGG